MLGSKLNQVSKKGAQHGKYSSVRMLMWSMKYTLIADGTYAATVFRYSPTSRFVFAKYT